MLAHTTKIWEGGREKKHVHDLSAAYSKRNIINESIKRKHY